MSNLLKGFYTKNADEERVIDYNAVISDKIESFRQKMEQEHVETDTFVSGLDVQTVEDLIGDTNVIGYENDTEDSSDNEEEVFSPGIDGVISGKMPSADAVRELAEDILEDANKRAEKIISEAKAQADSIKGEVYEQARREGEAIGYSEGVKKAEVEYQQLINDANEELARLEGEYHDRYNNMEKEIVETLLQVFEKVTYTVADDNREIILHLINRVMNDIESTGDILLRVSKDDYPFLIENQGKIYNASQKDINISIVEDISLETNQCIIETDGGVFDCSLDIQLEQLIKDIKLLSCI